jgi:hypothetical protein
MRNHASREDFVKKPVGVVAYALLEDDNSVLLVIEQPNYWLEGEIRAELVIHDSPVAYASPTHAYQCWCSGQMTDRTLPVQFKNVDEAF